MSCRKSVGLQWNLTYLDQFGANVDEADSGGVDIAALALEFGHAVESNGALARKGTGLPMPAAAGLLKSAADDAPAAPAAHRTADDAS